MSHRTLSRFSLQVAENIGRPTAEVARAWMLVWQCTYHYDKFGFLSECGQDRSNQPNSFSMITHYWLENIPVHDYSQNRVAEVIQSDYKLTTSML